MATRGTFKPIFVFALPRMMIQLINLALSLDVTFHKGVINLDFVEAKPILFVYCSLFIIWGFFSFCNILLADNLADRVSFWCWQINKVRTECEEIKRKNLVESGQKAVDNSLAMVTHRLYCTGPELPVVRALSFYNWTNVDAVGRHWELAFFDNLTTVSRRLRSIADR